MNTGEKIKKIAMIAIMGALSGYFMYSGFSIILSDNESNNTVIEK